MHWEECRWVQSFFDELIFFRKQQGKNFDEWYWSRAIDDLKTDYSKHIQLVNKQRYVFHHTKCPVCGGEYSDISFKGERNDLPSGYRGNYWDKWDKSVDNIFCYIHDKYDETCADLGKENADEHFSEFTALLESKYEIKSTAAVPSTNKALLPEQLRDYVMNLIQLETDILLSTDYLEELLNYYYPLKNSKTTLNMDMVVEKVNAYYERVNGYHETEREYQDAMDHLSQCKAKPVEDAPPGYSVPPEPQEPAKPELKKPGLFNKKKVEEQNRQLQEEYGKAMDSFRIELEIHKKRLDDLKRNAEKHHARIVKSAQNKVDSAKEKMEQMKQEEEQIKQDIEITRNEAMLSNQNASQSDVAAVFEEKIVEAKELLEKLYKTRSEMYGLDIVFGKYRNLVALSTFYEYLLSGRCDSLEGAHGAYNLYEAEIRADLIISQLSDVVECLEDIAETQYTVYTQLNNMNETINRLRTSMENTYDAIRGIKKATEQLEKNSEVIAFNTHAAAHYAKVNADLTNALGFMVALK